MSSEKSVIMPVTGMSCYNCANTIEVNIRKVPGIIRASVDFASEKLSLTFDSDQIAEREIIASIKRIGYGVAVGKTELPVSGMHDQNDAGTLEKMLLSLEGIIQITVSYATDRASIEYIPGVISISEIAGTIRKAGFDLIDSKDLEEMDDIETNLRSMDLKKQKDLLILGFFFTIPLLLYAMLLDFHLAGFKLDRFVMLIAATIVQFGTGWQFYRGAFSSLRLGRTNMDVLIVLGSSVAYFSSVLITIGILNHPHVYFETGATIITLIQLGKYLEKKAKGRTNEAIKALMGIRARTACIMKDGNEYEVDVDKVVVGDILVVYPGGKIPVDGIILEGHSSLDESMITGESVPVTKQPGDEVIGSTINREGRIKFEVSKVGKNTALAQIIKLVHETQASKAPIQKIADRIGAYFVPIVIGLAILTLILWLGVGHADWSDALMKTIAVLVIACPCAIGLATPTAIIVGTSTGAENGILFKNSELLEKASQINVLVLDKTGTITSGQPIITDTVVYGKHTSDEFLTLVASAELGSEHPIGKAIVQAAKNAALELIEPTRFKSMIGFGIQATVHGQQLIIGNPRYMDQEGISSDVYIHDTETLQVQGKTVMVAAVKPQNGYEPARVLGIIAIADSIKPGIAENINLFKQSGLRVIMITGDNQQTADAIAMQVGIKQVLAGVSPAEKAEAIRNLQSIENIPGKKNPVVAMVGDGINDAPALVQADIGIAIGTGTDIAITAAGITLINGNLSGIMHAITLSRLTRRTIIQNLVWAFLYNVVLIPMAALGLLNPMLAAGAMAFSSIFVVTNSLQLKHIDLNKFAPPKSIFHQLMELITRNRKKIRMKFFTL